jgi:hypothetical protein
LIGHVFTSSLGWVVVGVMLAGAGVWTYLERDWIFWKDTTIRSVQLDGDDLQFALQQFEYYKTTPEFKKFEFFVPRGTRTLEYAMISRFAHYSEVIYSLDKIQEECKDSEKTQRYCPNKTRQLNRVPFKISLVVGGTILKKDILEPYGSGSEKTTYPSQALSFKIVVNPSPNGWLVSQGYSPKTWSAYMKTPEIDIFAHDLTTTTRSLPLNEWTAFWSEKLSERLLKTGNRKALFSRIVRNPGALTLVNEVVIAVRASDKAPMELEPQALRVPPKTDANISTDSSIIETDIKKSTMSCPAPNQPSRTCFSGDKEPHYGIQGNFFGW